MSAFLRRLEAIAESDGMSKQQRIVRREQIRMLYDGLWQPVLASLIGALLLVMALWSVIGHSVLLAWLAAHSVISLLRLWLAIRFHRQTPTEQVRRCWLGWFALGAFAGGLAWGIAGLLFFSMEHYEYQAALAIILAGMGAGAVTTLSSVWGVAALFLIPTIAPLMIQYALVSSPVALFIAATMALFLALTLVVSRRLSLIIEDNIRLRVEVTEREASQRESENRYRTIFQSSPLGLLHFDHNGVVVECNDKLLEIMGAPREKMVGLDILRELPDERVKQAVGHALSEGFGYYEGDYVSMNSGKTMPLRAFFNGVRNADGDIVGGVTVIEDFTERKQAEATIHYQAYYDPLTDLPNRRLLLDRLSQTLSQSRRDGGLGAVLFLDLDRFKSVNDSLGHALGDRLLCDAAKRLTSLLRGGDIAARLSGDEFVVMVADLQGSREQAEHAARTVAVRIMDALSAPYVLSGRTLKVTPSIGYVLFPRAEETAVDLLKHADTAMYQAKAAGRARICGYLPSMQAEVERRVALEQDLRRALEQDQLLLFYQPQVDASGAIVGAEALLRWEHPQHGMISPEEFIPLAEESGLIVELDEWVLDEACRCLQQIDARDLPRLSINISPRHFNQPDFVSHVEALIHKAGIAPERLLFEVTEGVLIDHLLEAVAIMHALKRVGVGIAIDDFGTGYSSLSYLKRLPLDELKIDRSFVQDIVDPNDAAIVQTIIAISRHLKLDIVAEGVETAEQLAFLHANDCTRFQGYWFYRPMPLEGLTEALSVQRSASRESR
ncbi:PAS domain S-box-containing protein/diguanylate cyclase (GGDEF) domain-containing protein [Modicisalibacter muralis]|uniref:cyclic-guanylate-specific phosphodiesterase n=1 Tax=Modicisalibacter muralis TaxID=119000 RepID=A0A1G9PCJ8_9GAMM|nr:EAL domain-containing protein [Halomonas muralis]SDL96500.1 PAS domain S-box-containing protein/diguanylate cyclase (GGDEF) domain-containing protein [Halomonas muralis]